MSRILYIHQYFKTPKDSGGTRSYHLATAMVRAGHEVHLITSHNDTRCKQVEINGITVYYLPVKYRQEFGPLNKIKAYCRFAYQAYRQASKIAGVDLVYATSTPLTVGVIALLLKRLKGYNYIFEVRDLWPEVPIAMGVIRNGLAKRLLYSLTRQIYRRASAIVSLSPGITSGIMKYGSKASICELPNFSDTTLFHPASPNPVLQKAYLQDGEFGIVHFGAIGRINHLDYFLDAAEASKRAGLPLRFFIVGEGSEKERLVAEAFQKGLDNVVFLPAVAKEKLLDWLSIMDFSYIAVKHVPILSTNSANKFYDSLAAGKICITNIEGWMQQLVTREECGVNTDPLRPANFVAQLKPFLVDGELRKRYSANARRVSERYYSDQVITERLLILIRDLDPKGTRTDSAELACRRREEATPPQASVLFHRSTESNEPERHGIPR